SVGVADAHHVTGAAAVARDLDDPIADRTHRSTDRRGEVYAVVRTAHLQHRMEARLGEHRRDAAELEGVAQEVAAERLAVFAVVASHAVFADVTHGGVCAARDREERRVYRTRSDDFTVF